MIYYTILLHISSENKNLVKLPLGRMFFFCLKSLLFVLQVSLVMSLATRNCNCTLFKSPKECAFGYHMQINKPCNTSLVLIAGFRAGLAGFAGLKLGYPENPALKTKKPS